MDTLDTAADELADLLRIDDTAPLSLLAAAVHGHHLEAFGYPEYRADDAVRILAQRDEVGALLANAALRMIASSLDPESADDDDLLILASLIESAQLPVRFSETPHDRLARWIDRIRVVSTDLIRTHAEAYGRAVEAVRADILLKLRSIAQALRLQVSS